MLTPEKKRAILIEGAKRFAKADKSDPFAFARAVSEIDNRIATLTRVDPPGDDPEDRWPGYYDARRSFEERSYVVDGVTVTYQAEVFGSLARP